MRPGGTRRGRHRLPSLYGLPGNVDGPASGEQLHWDGPPLYHWTSWFWDGIHTYHHLPPGFLSLRNEEPLPKLSTQTPVSGYYWPRRTQVADNVVSPSCFRSSLGHSRGVHSVTLLVTLLSLNCSAHVLPEEGEPHNHLQERTAQDRGWLSGGAATAAQEGEGLQSVAGRVCHHTPHTGPQ